MQRRFRLSLTEPVAGSQRRVVHAVSTRPSYTQADSQPSHPYLQRRLGLMDAMMMGLGSILGTGIFVSIGLGAGIAGPSVMIAILLAAMVAACNALSSAQLAAAHPVSGGAYEYGYRFLKPSLGFLAGWTFLLAKSMSAATAALGFAGYLLTAFKITGVSNVWVALLTVLIFAGIVLSGIRLSSRVNTVMVSITIVTLLMFMVTGIGYSFSADGRPLFQPFFRGEDTASALQHLFHACALMFVAYTGYGRIATLAEEVEDPKRTIPRAILATLVVSAILYAGVSIAGIGAVGADFLFAATKGNAAPLDSAAREFGIPFLPGLIASGAVTAMLGVLLNLILGLSRVWLAMGRRHDMPSVLAQLDREGKTPWVAVLLTGGLIAGLTLMGSVKTTWSFSAFTVLIYYSITNAAAIAMPKELRLFPLWIPVAGLISCLFFAFWVDREIWITGLALLAAGLLWRMMWRFFCGESVGLPEPLIVQTPTRTKNGGQPMIHHRKDAEEIEDE